MLTSGGIEPVPMPTGYTQVEYIETDGNEWFNVGLTLTDDMTVDMVVQFTATTSGASNFTPCFQAGSGSNSWGQLDGYYYISKYVNSGVSALTKVNAHYYTASNARHLEINGVHVSRAKLAGSSIQLFGGGNQGLNASARMWRCKIYVNGTLVRDFVPCRDGSNVGYLYDAANDQIYNKYGSGDLIIGPDVI